jgi:exonuclease III
VPSARSLTFVKETLLKLIKIKPHKLIVGDLNSTVPPMNMSARHKINRAITKLTEVMIQIDLTDIYRTFHPTSKEYTFFSMPHRAFSKIDHIKVTRANLNIYMKTEITSCIL